MTGERLIITTGTASDGSSEISSEWFGMIQTGYRPYNGFESAVDQVGIGLLRWPGGTISETRPEVYGLDIPGLFDATDLWAHNPNRQRPDLADSLDYAVANGIAFSMIIPTARYVDDLQTGEAHLRAFLEDLLVGGYGPLPANFTLEIGNEFYALDAFADDPGAYGIVASRFAEIMAELVATHLSPEEQDRIEIAVQIGRSANENNSILSAFSPDALAAISSLVFHSLPISLNNLNRTHDDRDGLTRYDATANHFEVWQQAILAAGGNATPDLFLSAWAVGGSGGGDGEADTVWHEYGSRSLAMVLDTFAGYASIGVDAAAVWGVNSDHNNRVSSAEGTSSELSHIGELLALMSQSLPGMELRGEFNAHSREDETMVWSFGNGTDYASYVAVNQFVGETHDLVVSYGGVSNYQISSATLISSEYDPNFTGSSTDADASLYERPVVEALQFDLAVEGISFAFQTSYELAEIVIRENEGTSGSSGIDWISGSEGDEVFEGYEGDDFIFANDGDDTLSGGAGSDQLLGGAGNDVILGDDDAIAEWTLYLQSFENEWNSNEAAETLSTMPGPTESLADGFFENVSDPTYL